MQRKLIIIAALAVATFCAKAQSIRVFNGCREKSRTFTFVKADAYSNILKTYTIGSWCMQQQMPVYKLDAGNYEFDNLPVRENEDWRWFIDKGGKELRRGTVTNGTIWAVLDEGERLTITIAPKFDCNCQAAK